MTSKLFTPTAQQIEQSQLTQFAKQLQLTTGHHFSTYQDLHAFSIQNLSTFWSNIWDFGKVIGHKGQTILDNPTMPGANWFPDSTLNFAENLLAHGDSIQDAFISISESRGVEKTSYKELKRQVLQLAAYLTQECGVQSGDRICAYLGNTPEAIIGMLATTYLGAVWSSASPDFGLEGALDRFGQIEPKVIIAGNGYRYGGKDFERHDVVNTLAKEIPTLQKVISVQVLPGSSPLLNATPLNEILEGDRESPECTQFPFNHPLYILFSSGTTGKPKCIVHSAGGTLLQHIKELRLHADINAQSKFFYFTTTGWMMWNWLASGLVTGATIVLYDGNPMYPKPDTLWQHCAEHQFTHFGTSAKFLSACRKMNVLVSTSKLDSLNVIFSTGSPLAPEDFDWVYNAVKQDVMLHSISGGTDIVSCFVGGNPWSSVVKGKIQAANLGMAVESWSDEGKAQVNQRGELVCTAPAPCMPIGFWNDNGNERYHAAYFERFPGVWSQGDFCEIDEKGQVVILGRSDTTLNPGGVRIGTAEIYRQVELVEEVMDALVVGRPTEDDVEVILFVVLKTGTLTPDLEHKLKQQIKQNTTPRHVPRHILQVKEIPYTRSGKKVELAVTEILRGDEPRNLTALSDAGVLDQYRILANSF
jgi:acetoacetyl-CoA synthetase